MRLERARQLSESMVDGDVLRRAMRRVSSPVTVVTAEGMGEVRGITVGSFTSVSLDPPLISFLVACEARMHDVIADAAGYAVHVLSSEQARLATIFAEPDRTGPEQFAAVSCELDDNDIPSLTDAPVVFHSTPYAMHPAGDHSLFIGRVRSVTLGVSDSPLVYWDGSYYRLGVRLPERVWPF